MTIKVKICGLTNLADAQTAVQAGADFLGFIFYPPSPRNVSPVIVKEILFALKPLPASIMTVGVFVDQTVEQMIQTLDYCGLDVAQLHGKENPEMLGLARPGQHPMHGRAYKALRPASLSEGLRLAEAYALPPSMRINERLPALLLDTYHPQFVGGTGKTANWDMMSRLSGLYPLLLAGGLTADNVAEAAHQVRPWGVDVSSGVEREPGVKDHSAVRAFIENVRKYEESS